MGRVTGALTAVVLVVGMSPAFASASSTYARGGRDTSEFCEAGRAIKALYDAEAGVDMKDPRSVRKVRRVVADLQEVAPAELASSFRRLMRFYGLVISGDIQLVGGDQDRYFEASEPAARGAYRIAQMLQRRCGVRFQG